ncbi:MAG: symmetrical bis(5'-nucleosyl)-tetraphosphatase [Casimicrobiaceae bacterium]
MSTYVVGDVQGCNAELEELLGVTRFDPKCDRIYFVGDLVNRGPDSAAVLRRVRHLAEQGAADSVLGNHDFFLIMAHAGLARPHPGDTLDDVLSAPDADALVEWLRHRPLLIDLPGATIVHAGLLPAWTLAEARCLAREIESALRADDPVPFLRELFGNEPRQWSPELTGMARARVVVNAFARMRFCSADSRLEFAEKRDRTHAPAGFAPWFAHPERGSRGRAVLAGHWSSEGLRRWPTVTLLDSGCLWGGALTALRLEDGAFFQVPSRQSVSLATD